MHYRLRQRLLFYSILAVLCSIVPYLAMVISIVITGDRAEGMSMGFLPGIFAVHVIFGFSFLRPIGLKKIFLILLVSAMSTGAWILVYSYSNGFFDLGLDMYGFWDSALTNFLVGLAAWEVTYQLRRRLTKN